MSLQGRKIRAIAGALAAAAIVASPGWGPAGAALATGPATAPTATPAAAGTSASELIRKRLYNDAIKVLLQEVKAAPAAQVAKKYLMLGECYYMTQQYAEARPCFAQARSGLKDPEDMVIAEYRLACTTFRMGDFDGAIDRIAAFERKYPNDSRTSTLLVFEMKALARRGKAAQEELEKVHKHLTAEGGRTPATTVLAADRVLTDYYVAIGDAEKAKRKYASIVHNCRNLLAQWPADKGPPPADIQQAHDNAAMQLAAVAIREGQNAEAARWLENIKYDAELTARANLLLAQLAYQQQDYERAISRLTGPDVSQAEQAEPTRSDVYLILGLSHKNKKAGDAEKAAQCLEKVAVASKGYAQAQAALGELYRQRGFTDRAIRAYTVAADAPAYAPEALLELGRIYLAAAEETSDAARQALLYRKAAEAFSKLGTSYPLSKQAKQAAEPVEALVKKGYDVASAVSEDEKARQWQKTAAEKPGTPEAIQSMLSLIRYHQKAVVEDKTGRYLKAPNYVACAAACDKLLDPNVYTGRGLAAEAWQGIRCEASYYRGCCELAAATPGGNGDRHRIGETHADSEPVPSFAKDGLTPLYLPKADLGRAVAAFRQAKALADPKQLEMVKSIELGLLEAMFKSPGPDNRQAAEKRFAELANEYGADARFQKLAMDLAEWYRAQGRLSEAAREYRGIADRGKDLPREDVLKALYLAGSLYSAAAGLAAEKPAESGYAIYVHPQEVMRIGDLLKTPPFQKVIKLPAPKAGGPPMTAAAALTAISRAGGIPFVWSPDRPKEKDSVAGYLNGTTATLDQAGGDAGGTIERYIRQVLPMEHYRLDYDIGLAGGPPTIAPPPPSPVKTPASADGEDPIRPVEIFDSRLWERRYAPLMHEYGAWKSVHSGAKGEMLYNVLARIEALSKTKIVWAAGIDQRDVQAAEYREVPGVKPSANCSCAMVLAKVLEPLGLSYAIIQRDLSAELYEQAKECFNELRKIDPRSKYGEKSLFLLALNYQQQHELERMKVVLKEYLKTFDQPGSEHFHEACFWVGWALEQERKYREACHYYARAAEERIVVYRPAAAAASAPAAAGADAGYGGLRLSHEALVALEEPVSGEFRGVRLDPDVFDFVRVNTNVKMRLEGGPTEAAAVVTREPFRKVPCLEVLRGVLDSLGLAMRVENVGKTIADRAYYRLAACYQKDGQNDQALEACNALLSRFPKTARKRDAYKLKLEIHKGLRDYRSVLATLNDLRDKCPDQIEAYKQDFEIGWIQFDLCRYDKAAESFRKSLAAANDPAERTKIRDGYARALLRAGNLKEALAQYQALAAEETEPLRQFVAAMMKAYLQAALDNLPQVPLPEYAEKLIIAYESLSDAQRGRLSKADLAKATWIYYLTALTDLRAGRTEAAMRKLAAAANSPDDSVAGECSYLLATIHMKRGDFRKAREVLEDLLFTARTTESEVKGTYALATCLAALGDSEKAAQRLRQIVDRFPDSPYADQARGSPLMKKGPATAAATSRAVAP